MSNNNHIHLKIDLQGVPDVILGFLETVVYYIERDLDKSEFLEIDSVDDPSDIHGTAEILLAEERTTPRSFIWDIIDNLADEGVPVEELMQRAIPILIQKTQAELGLRLNADQAEWYLEEAVKEYL